MDFEQASYEKNKSNYQKYIRVALILLTSFPNKIIIGSDFSTHYIRVLKNSVHSFSGGQYGSKFETFGQQGCG